MPIWLELMFLLLLTYIAGIGIGWAIWGRAGDTPAPLPQNKPQREEEG